MANAEIRIDTRIGTDKMSGDLGKVSKEVSRLQSLFAKQTAAIQETEKALADMNVQLKAITEGDVELKSIAKMNSDLEALQTKWKENAFKVDEYAVKIEKAKMKLAELQKTPGVDAVAIEAAEVNIAKLTYQFNKLLDEQDRIDESSNKLREAMEAIKLDPTLSEEYKRLAASIAEMEAKLAGQTDAANQTAQALKRALEVPTEPLKQGISGISKEARKASTNVNKLGKETKTVGTHARHAASGFERMAGKLKTMILSVAVFSVIRSALTALRNQMSSMLKTNAQFNASWNAIKVNLLTAFQPIYEAILPALNALMSTLAKVTYYLASFISMLFGKTYEQSKASAAAIYDQANALDKTGKAAKKASKNLLAFDEINQKAAETAADNAGADASGLDFGAAQDVSWLSGIADIFENIRIALEPTIEALGRLWEALQTLGGFAWDALKTFYNDFLVPVGQWVLGEGLPRLIDGLTRMINEINWTKINESLERFWEALAPFAITIGEGLLWFYETVLVPFGIWIGNNFLPAFFEALSSVVKGLDKHFKTLGDAIKWLWDNALKPLAGFVGDAIVSFLEWVKKHGDLVAGILIGIGTALLAFKIASSISKGVQALTTAFSALDTSMLFGKGLITIGIVLGTLVALSDLSPELTIALGILAGAITTLGVAMTLGFGPVGWIVGALAGLAVAAVSVGTALSKDCIPEIERFDDSISDATQKSVGEFMDLLDDTTLLLRKLAATSDTVTDEMAIAVIGNYRKMREMAIDEITKQKNETIDNLKYLFQEEAAMYDERVNAINKKYEKELENLKNNTDLTEEQYNERLRILEEAKVAEILAMQEGATEEEKIYLQRLADAEQHYADKQAAVEEKEDAIRQIIKQAAIENRELTDEENKKIEELNNQFFEAGVKALTENVDEQETIIKKANENELDLRKRQASEILQEAARERDESIEIARQKYNDLVAEAEKLREDGTDEAIKRADELLLEASREKKESIEIAKAKYEGIVKETTKGMENIDKEIDINTGKIKSKWTQFWEGLIEGIKNWWKPIGDWFNNLFSGGSSSFPSSGSFPQFASGGFTNGVSIAGEDGTEAIISFDPRYRYKNIDIWEQAGEMLGVSPQLSAALNNFSISPEIMQAIVESEQRRNVVRNTASDNYDMAQAIGEAVAANIQTQTQAGTVHVVLEVGGQQFGEASVKYGDQERNRQGNRMSNRKVTT